MEESVPEDEAGEYAHLVVFSAEKAGMASVDKAHINKVIYEMSKDSACFKSLQEQGKRTTDKIQATREKIASVDEHSLQLALHRVNQLVDKLTQQRKLERLYCVIDMDMFYAAVEMRDNPKLIGKPVAVGGMSMICTANYEARRFGVRSAMPGFMAKKLCPQLIFVKTNFQKYKHVSMQVKNIFLEYDENLSMMSLDEAKLDLTEYIDSRLGTDKPFEDRMSYAETVVNEIRSRVAKTTRLTCSAGISSSKLLAKVASDINKPNGQCKVPHVIEEMIEFTHALQIRKIPGIGKVSERVLTEAFGIKTVGDLWGKRAICYHLCTENQIERKYLHWHKKQQYNTYYDYCRLYANLLVCYE
uniref:DNA polymerase kappa n=1 Tax=Mucochytrium quahogii TaxID=96639 RepID=A0A7S2SJ72_9STRA|mmetsp:Transcript_6780/g.15148  ORF Transcript_6780/g.15148 Transcript_6780/m.15148 type:complete len:358 (+) Transcript_6780:1246-2319(+)